MGGRTDHAIVGYVIMANVFDLGLFYTILQATSKVEILNDFNKFS